MHEYNRLILTLRSERTILSSTIDSLVFDHDVRTQETLSKHYCTSIPTITNHNIRTGVGTSRAHSPLDLRACPGHCNYPRRKTSCMLDVYGVGRETAEDRERT